VQSEVFETNIHLIKGADFFVRKFFGQTFFRFPADSRMRPARFERFGFRGGRFSRSIAFPPPTKNLRKK
jgi:hypothetical protein